MPEVEENPLSAISAGIPDRDALKQIDTDQPVYDC
jgi:hypothetical protein